MVATTVVATASAMVATTVVATASAMVATTVVATASAVVAAVVAAVAATVVVVDPADRAGGVVERRRRGSARCAECGSTGQHDTGRGQGEETPRALCSHRRYLPFHRLSRLRFGNA
jgi:hypothetical protein